MGKKLLVTLMLMGICLVSGCAGVTTGHHAAVENQQALVATTLDALVAAYEGKNSRQFSEHVSDGYVGEKTLLDRALLRDFGAFHNLSLRYTLNNVTPADQGKVAVALTFTRAWTEVKTGTTKSETKETTLVFIREKGGYKLLSQGKPLMFGLN